MYPPDSAIWQPRHLVDGVVVVVAAGGGADVVVVAGNGGGADVAAIAVACRRCGSGCGGWVRPRCWHPANVVTNKYIYG